MNTLINLSGFGTKKAKMVIKIDIHAANKFLFKNLICFCLLKQVHQHKILKCPIIKFAINLIKKFCKVSSVILSQLLIKPCRN